MTTPTVEHDQVLIDLLTAASGLDPSVGIPTSSRTTLEDPHGLFARAARPGLGTWLTQAARLKGCTRPVRLIGRVTTMDARGVVVDTFNTADLPDGVLYKPCGTRFASLCKACSETYRWDTYQLIRAGLSGGKGVPETVIAHPAVFVTLTAPSFGPVHTQAVDTRIGEPRPCRPRRDKPTCPHGRHLFCPYVHHDSDRRIGQPLCLDCYDHNHQAVWNHFVPKLWDRTIVRLRRLVAAELGDELAARIRISYVKIAELQARAAVHLHAIIRLDGHDPADPSSVVTPPAVSLHDGTTMPLLTADQLAQLVVQAARHVGLVTPPHRDQPDGWRVVWGKQLDAKVIQRGLDDGELTERHVAGYLAKYATKGTEATGLIATRITASNLHAYRDPATHIGRLITACWHLGRRDPAFGLLFHKERPYRGLRRWAHLFGYGGHFSTKSRRYSTTLGKIRTARLRVARAIARGLDSSALSEEDNQQTHTIIARWRYIGTGWLTTGDAALALMAADAARRRRPAGTPSATTA